MGPTPEQFQEFLALPNSPIVMVEMARSEEYQAISHHRTAGLVGQINYAVVHS